MISNSISSSSQGRSSSRPQKPVQGCFPTISTTLAIKGRFSPYRVYAIHGLNSSIDTWTANDNVRFKWLDRLPRWLYANGGSAADVSLVSWNTQIFSAANISTQIQSDVRMLANEIMKQYGENNDIRPSREQRGSRQRVIFIGHSMGGILTRALLGWMHQQGNYVDFLSRVDGVILLASPSEGSGLANFAEPFSNAFRGVSPGMSLLINPSHLKGLKPGSQDLAEINFLFAAYCKSRNGQGKIEPLKVACLKETAREKGIVQIVNDRSGDIPQQAAPYVRWETDTLEGLSHTQVTSYTMPEAMANSDNLRKIIKQFLRMQNVQKEYNQINLRV